MWHAVSYSLFLILLILSTEIQADKFKYIAFGKKLYHIGKNERVNWYAAWNFCATRDMKLLSIETADESEFLKEYLTREDLLKRKFWTSGNDSAKYGTYYWFGTGKEIDYTNWKNDEPDGEHEHCIRTGSDFKWHDAHCKELGHILCERTADSIESE